MYRTRRAARIMRQNIDRITCDGCGQVFDFERLRLDGREKLARIEPLSDWLRLRGWTVEPVIGSGFQTVDKCPNCKG